MRREVLVLSGGGSRGAYQAGALQTLLEAGYAPDLAVGVSIGAVNAAALCSGADPAHVCRVWAGLRTRDIVRWRINWRERRVHADRGHLRTFLDRIIDWKRLGSRFPLRVGAVDLDRRAWRQWDTPSVIPEHVLASIALPPVFAPVSVDGRPHVDGGLWQNPPVDAALDAPAARLTVLCHEPVAPHRGPTGGTLRAQAAALSDVVWHGRAKDALAGVEVRRALPPTHARHAAVRDLRVIAPRRSIVPDLLRFEPGQLREAVQHGRADARAFL